MLIVCHCIIFVLLFIKTTGVYWPMKGSTFKHGKMNVKLEETVETQDFKRMKLNFHDNAQVNISSNLVSE